MTWSETTVVVVGVLLLLAWWLWVMASRLDRLHRKVAASRSVVQAQLLRRASAAADLAAAGVLDPVSAVLVGEAAWAALAAGGDAARRVDVPAELGHLVDTTADPSPEDRGAVESDLSATLREVLDDPDEVAAIRSEPEGADALDALAAAWYRVHLARRFHNEAVAQTQRVRRSRRVRWLRLAGHAPEPETLELDDAWPEALGRPGQVAGVPGGERPAL